MSLNDIQLSSYLCQSLFTKNLVGDTEPPNSSKKKQITINSLGENKKSILFLVNNSQNKFLDDEEMNLLTNLLIACKLSMADIALANYYHFDKINYKELIDYFQSKKILLFGITTSELGLPFVIPDFQIQSYLEKLFMAAPSLREFINNKELKKALWTSLQKIF